MVMQADGASLRQMAFTEIGGRIQDKLITDYHYIDDRNWTIDSIEVQQGFGSASAVLVSFVVKNGRFNMRKHRKFEGGAAAAREYESLGSLDRPQRIVLSLSVPSSIKDEICKPSSTFSVGGWNSANATNQNVGWIIPWVQSIHRLSIAVVISSVFMVDLRLLEVIGRS